MTEKLTLNIEDACKLIGISKSFGYALARKNQFPGLLKLGKRLVVSKYQLEKYLNGDNEVKADAAD